MEALYIGARKRAPWITSSGGLFVKWEWTTGVLRRAPLRVAANLELDDLYEFNCA